MCPYENHFKVQKLSLHLHPAKVFSDLMSLDLDSASLKNVTKVSSEFPLSMIRENRQLVTDEPVGFEK